VQTALSEIRSPDTVSASFSFLVTNHFPLPPFPLSLFRSVVLCPLIAVNRAKETKTTCATCFCSTSVPFIHFISIPFIFSGSFEFERKRFSFLISRFSFLVYRSSFFVYLRTCNINWWSLSSSTIVFLTVGV
jgi:hypothetical protein